MHLRSIALALAVLPLLVMPVRAQDGPATPQNSSRTDLFIGLGGQSRLGNGDAGWRSAVPLSVDVNVTDRVALVVMPALGVGVSTSTRELGGLRVPGRTAVPVRRAAARDALRQILAGVQHGTVAPANGVAPASPPDRGTAFLMSFGGRRRDPEPTVRVARHPGRERRQFGDLSGGHQLAVSSGLVIRFGTRK